MRSLARRFHGSTGFWRLLQIVTLVTNSLIGPDVDVAGTSGKAHEFGGRYKKEHYAKRAFMGPALEKVQPRLPKFWAGSVKGD